MPRKTVRSPGSSGSSELSDALLGIASDRKTGAYGLAVATLRAIARAVGPWGRDAPTRVRQDLRKVAAQLRETQPAMGVFRRWAIEWTRIAADAPDRDLVPSIIRWLRSWKEQLRQEPVRLAAVARRQLPPRLRILTLSRSDSVRRALLASGPTRRPREVIVLRSLPGGEGSTFAQELRRAGLRARTVSDAEGRRMVPRADLVLVGADAVYGDGSVVHKVGTRPLTLAALRAGVPVIVVAGRSKSVPGPCPSRTLPPRFDRTPARAVREFWTDRGVVAAAEWSRRAIRNR